MNRNTVPNAFELVVLAGQRARQLLKGCVPKVEGADKPVKTAAREIASGVIQKVEEPTTPTS